MEQKKCTKCGQWKECTRKEDKERYANDEKRREAIKAVHNNQVKYLRKYVQDVKEHSKCAICGDSRWYVLDFHHVREKDFTISQKIKEGCSLETIKKEIEKCIILCANCHREIHYKERIQNGEE